MISLLLYKEQKRDSETLAAAVLLLQVPQVAGITIEEEEEEAGSPMVSDDDSGDDDSADEGESDADSILVTDEDKEGPSYEAGDNVGEPGEGDDSDLDHHAAARAHTTRQPALRNELQVF